MKIYSAVGYAIILFYGLACVWLAPPQFGPWGGLAFGMGYFLVCWFIGGLYLSPVLHMGIAHRALDYRDWFVKGLTLVSSALVIYVDPVAWVNRHRLHHKFSDHPGDPNKLASDGFWRTLWLCLVPYPSEMSMAGDEIFKSWPFRLVANWPFAVLAQPASFALLWWLVRDLRFAAMIWVTFRVFALWVNMVQNFWTHDRRFGYRRHDDARDNAMNVGEWLPVTATFSACLQNNHHHSPGLLRLSHEESEYDFGFLTVKAMKALGLVKATAKGAAIPREVPLAALNF